MTKTLSEKVKEYERKERERKRILSEKVKEYKKREKERKRKIRKRKIEKTKKTFSKVRRGMDTFQKNIDRANKRFYNR
ncbi:unnamed protein product [marine sediment metagenome]|uniref:Uncharacterized protein n=1 Tax=marine sediment metagenome TaxID=412755 RepID=X1TEV0_9ZZZZ